MTPEERQAIFDEVQARSSASLEKRRKERKNMRPSGLYAENTKEPVKPASDKKMSPTPTPTIGGAIGAIKNRKKQLEAVK